FNQVLAGSKPRLTMRVPNTIANDDSTLGVELEFSHMDDFGPEAVAQQVAPLRKLVEARQRLNELALRVNASDRLEELLQDVVQNTDALKSMADAGRDEKDKKDSPRGEGE